MFSLREVRGKRVGLHRPNLCQYSIAVCKLFVKYRNLKIEIGGGMRVREFNRKGSNHPGARTFTKG
jgi:hypothetical protein